ncbi:hypothetical protein NDU88_001176 [Pleurodeles waltl]|uniref:SRCR domain-containing protein n=1 Tax=Pleurodeles waltl TaxID=8319 RepID=A0AAV7MIZ7_PLEWA|nr:hypothetical protein NDU88_001176 [Pleurodeles waltl]
MACVAGERAPAFTNEELEKLVDGVLPQYAKLYGRLEVQVSTHQKRGLWHAIAKEAWTLQEEGGGTARWARMICEAQLGKSSQRGRGACRALTPPYATHPDGGIPGPGWALEGCTAVTRG